MEHANIPVWDDSEWEPLPTLEGDARADVCVIGLGGSGLSCARELLELGKSVVAVDAAAVGGGAAGRNGGFLLAGLAPFYHQVVAELGRERARGLYELTLKELDRIAAETPEAVRMVGSLRVAASESETEDIRLQLSAMEADHLPVSAYEGPEGIGILIPTDGSYNPLQRCRTLAARLRQDGAQLFERSRVISISRDLVQTSVGAVHCESVIVAVDGNIEQLLPELRGRVRTARLQMLATAPTDEITVPRPVYSRYGLEYWQQLPDGRIALGGFRDHGGEAEWTGAGLPSPRVQDELTSFLRGHLGVTSPVTHRWAAPVGFSSTSLPVLDEVRPGVWALGGYSGTGNVLGALCGRLAARLAARRETPEARLFRD